MSEYLQNDVPVDEIVCNAWKEEGCILHELFGLAPYQFCRGGEWSNRDIAPHIVRIEPCDARVIYPPESPPDVI